MSTQLEGSLSNFFSQYIGFEYDPSNAPNSEFYRLCDHFNWERHDYERESAYDEFKDALTQQFNANYGTDAEDLDAWQNLCIRLNIEPVPSTLKRCRQVVTDTHVNLIDLVHGYENSHQSITKFTSVKALSEYTISTGKYFPRDNVHAGDLLKYLLRQILNPPSDQQRHSRGGKRRGGPSARRRRGGA